MAPRGAQVNVAPCTTLPGGVKESVWAVNEDRCAVEFLRRHLKILRHLRFLRDGSLVAPVVSLGDERI
jgi:hypothetical protein